MAKFRSEQGATLVLTLFIVTLMLLFVLTLFYQVTNTTKQVTTIEKNIDARNIAEMGVEYYYQKIKYLYEQGVTIEEIIGQIRDEKPVVISENRFFELTSIDNANSNKISISCTGTSFEKTVTEKNEIMLVEN